jgi:hypothetical protein
MPQTDIFRLFYARKGRKTEEKPRIDSFETKREHEESVRI